MFGRRKVLGLLAVVAVLAGCRSSGEAGTTTGRASSSTSTTTGRQTLGVAVDLRATPKGWVPVDYGAAQFSVPADWTVAYTDISCIFPTEAGPGVVVLPSTLGGTCHEPSEHHVGPVLRIGTDTTAPPGATPVTVNGINGWEYPSRVCPSCVTEFGFPPLGITMGVSPGPLRSLATEARDAVDSLTHSPRAVVLAQGPPPTVPSTWRRASFGGVSLAVPSAWPVERGSVYGAYCSFLSSVTFGTTEVSLNSGAKFLALPCPYIPPAFSARSAVAVDGVLVDPGRYNPVQGDPLGRCVSINGLRACPDTGYPYGILTLAVHVPGRKMPVAVQIGLAGNGIMARTILDSMRAA